MEFKDQLKSAVDIVQVVGEYVRLRKSGAARYTGLCPFHSEKTPSFSVHAGHQFYKCFGCGVAGDAIKFVMEIEALSFWEAMRQLADRYGIPVPKRSDFSDEETKQRAALYEMHEIAQRAYRAALDSPAGAEARAYLTKRSVGRELIEEFGLGLSDRSGQTLVRAFQQRAFSAESMEQSGLVRKRDDGGFYDAFRGRLMFPIHNESGKLVGFAGRALSDDDQPKYLNSPATPIYYKSSILYNMHRAKTAIRKEESSILVEGYMDVIGLHGAGVRHAVASCGTALTPQQVRALRRHASNIVVNFDPDAAGGAAAERSIQMMLEESMHIRVLQLDGELDPDEYVKEKGVEAYRESLRKAQRYFYWLADRARGRGDMASAEGRVAAFQFLLPALQRVPDKIERVSVASDLASYLGVDSGLVLEQFRKAASTRADTTLRVPRRQLPAGERILLHCLLESEAARQAVLPRLKNSPSAERLVARKIFEAMVNLGDRYNYPDLEARLEDPEKDLLAGLLLADEVSNPSDPVAQAMESLARLENSGETSERAALKLRVREAEKSGNVAEAIRLTEELLRMERRMDLPRQESVVE